MIKGLILDVDGVLVGNKKGFNWPSPHPITIQTLKSLREKGLIITLCTGKGTFAIRKIVEDAHLDNPHIGDGGAIIMDFLQNKLIEQHVIGKNLTKEVLHLLQLNNFYVELYTKDGYYIQKDNVSEKTGKHTAILGQEPVKAPSLSDISGQIDCIKIMPVVNDESEKQKIIHLLLPYDQKLTLQWGVHPTASPYHFGIITERGISKKHSARVISKHSGVSLSAILGVGDSMTDWQFMDICGYAGAMGNSSPELKENVQRMADRGYIGKSVNENGLIDILKHFHVVE